MLNILEPADAGLSSMALQARLNMPASKIDQVLKLLDLESPPPISKIGCRWFRTSVAYQPDMAKIETLTQIRKDEQAQMQAYMDSKSCLMRFLQQALNDSETTSCGRCAACAGHPLIPETFTLEAANRAALFLKRVDRPIEARKQLAAALNLTFIDCLHKIHPTEPQKRMQNSFRQAANLSGAFEVACAPPDGPLLLVDDIVDSRWTLTVLTALLKQAGAGPVYPFALAMATPSGSS